MENKSVANSIKWNNIQNTKDTNYMNASVNPNIYLNSNIDNNNIAITREILDKINGVSRRSFNISTIIAVYLFFISIGFVIYWIFYYPNIIYSWNNIVYIFWIPFICWFLLLFLNTYFVKQELNFEKIKWEIEVNQEDDILEKKSLLNEIFDYLEENECFSRADYKLKSRMVWFNKNEKRIIEFIFTSNYFQIAVAQKDNLKKLLEEIPSNPETFWTSYRLAKVSYDKINNNILKIIIDEVLKK